MSTLFHELLFRPFLNLTVAVYNVLPGADFGVAIIVLTILIKIVFLPLTVKTIKSQHKMNELGPELQAIKDKFKDDKAAQSTAIMQLYKSKGIHPLSGCLPLLIQLPILIGLYRAFLAGINPESLKALYPFVSNPGEINRFFLGWVDITAKAPIMAILAGVFQAIQAKFGSQLTQAGAGKEMAALNKQMLYFFPVMIIIIGWNLPAGLMLYWITSTLFSLFEQTYIRKLVIK